MALRILVEKTHSPRRMNAMRPWSEAAGSAAQADPVPSSCCTSSNGAGPTVEVIGGPFPGSAPIADTSGGTGVGAVTVSGLAKNREVVVAPTVMPAGEIPGLPTVPVPGPTLPEAITTVTPDSVAAATATARGSRVGGPEAGAPRLR